MTVAMLGFSSYYVIDLLDQGETAGKKGPKFNAYKI